MPAKQNKKIQVAKFIKQRKTGVVKETYDNHEVYLSFYFAGKRTENRLGLARNLYEQFTPA